MRNTNNTTLSIVRAALCAVGLFQSCALSAWSQEAGATNAPAKPAGSDVQLKLPESPTSIPAPPAAPTTGSSGDLVLVGQNATVAEGEAISGDAVVVAGNLTVNGKVNGDAVCVGGKLTVGPTAQIGGDLVTVGSVAEIDPAAKIRGSKVNVASFPMDLMKHLGPLTQAYGKAASGSRDRAREARGTAVFFFILEIVFFALLAFIAILMTTFMPAQFARVTEHIEGDFGRSALLGLLLMFVLPVGAVILSLTLVLTMFGLPLVPLVPLAAGLGLLVGYVALGHALGRRWFGAKGPMFQALAGLAALQCAAILGDIIGLAAGPKSAFALALGALGMLICIAGSFVGLGAIVSSHFGKRTLSQTSAARKTGPDIPPPLGPV